MPMSPDFNERLWPNLQVMTDYFGTPFHLYDEIGIRETGQSLLAAFGQLLPGFNNFYAIKALPNPEILSTVKDLGMGFDCSSIPELNLARRAGATPEQIMFTSNNTSIEELEAALAEGGCILNLDDLSLISRVPGPFPELICFRYNPGPRRIISDGIFSSPESCKYGVPHEQIIEAYRLAQQRGARRFGLHTMVVSNELNASCFVETTIMLLDVAAMITAELDITFEFINIGGGLGIPYRLDDQPIDLAWLAQEISNAIKQFANRFGYQPRLFMECGRFITGPHGALVARCINKKSGYQEFRGLDASAISTMMRPPMYHPNGGYHHLTVCDFRGRPKTKPPYLRINVVGSACEDNDRFAWDRLLPDIEPGDLVIIHDTGAHCLAMANNYNGRLRAQELLLKDNDSVELIRRAETEVDLMATLSFKEQNLLLIPQKAA